MSVYVDDARHPLKYMLMCHMVADTPKELHRMAMLIGVRHYWYQRNASFPHYDICQSKRALAVKHGAVQLTQRQLAMKIKEIRAARSYVETDQTGKTTIYGENQGE